MFTTYYWFLIHGLKVFAYVTLSRCLNMSNAKNKMHPYNRLFGMGNVLVPSTKEWHRSSGSLNAVLSYHKHNIYIMLLHIDQASNCVFSFVHGSQTLPYWESVLYSPIMCNVICECSENRWKKWALTIYSKNKWSLLHFFFLAVSLIPFFSLSKVPLSKYVSWIIKILCKSKTFFFFLKNSEVKGLLTSLQTPSNNVSCASLFLGRKPVVHFTVMLTFAVFHFAQDC